MVRQDIENGVISNRVTKATYEVVYDEKKLIVDEGKNCFANKRR